MSENIGKVAIMCHAAGYYSYESEYWYVITVSGETEKSFFYVNPGSSRRKRAPKDHFVGFTDRTYEEAASIVKDALSARTYLRQLALRNCREIIEGIVEGKSDV